jgi:hypothetical protein
MTLTTSLKSLVIMAVLAEGRETGILRKLENRKLTTVTKKKKQGKKSKANLALAGDSPSSITSTTDFDASVQAYLVKEGEDGYKPGQVQWKVKIKSDHAPEIKRSLKCTTAGGCPNGADENEVKEVTGLQCKSYNWHIHAKKVGEHNECGGDFTGGHVDAKFACGPASEYQATTCTALDGGNWVSGYGGRCNGGAADGSSAQNKCEYGDLSGKMGKVSVDKGKTYYIDNFLQPLDTYDATSIVFHCCVGAPEYNNGNLDCGARIACGDFEDDWMNQQESCNEGRELVVLNNDGTGKCLPKKEKGCYENRGDVEPIEGCECHESCKACGYDGNNGIKDCITCANPESKLIEKFDDGTGKCV